MGQLFSACPLWFCWNHRHDQPEPTGANNEPDERTPLIVHPPQPRLPPQPVPDTAQQLADEAAANKIVDETVRCLVHVYSQAPFSHLAVDNQVPETSHTPDGSTGSTTTWRAYDPPSCPPISPEIRRLRLGYDQPGPSSALSSQPINLNQKRSYHSLKKIVNQSLRAPPSPSIIITSSQSTQTPHLTIPAAIEEADSQHPREATITSESQYDTITSFQTALDDNLPLDQSLASLPDSRPNPPPDFVGHLWPDFPNVSALPESSEFLTDDPKDLQALLESGYRLPDPGPLLVDL